MQVRAADDPRPRLPRPRQTGRVMRCGHGAVRHGAAAGRGRLTRHVDEVLDGQADAGTRCLVAGDEGGHPVIVSGSGVGGRAPRHPEVVWVVTVAPGGNWNSDAGGDDE